MVYLKTVVFFLVKCLWVKDVLWVFDREILKHVIFSCLWVIIWENIFLSKIFFE